VSVKQQGTADVNVTNSSLTIQPQAPITGGSGFFQNDGGQNSTLASTQTATALVINFTANAFAVELLSDTDRVAIFNGPASVTGNRNYQLALTRPIAFNHIHCYGAVTETCGVFWIGNEP
jgi:hypothetical protein